MIRFIFDHADELEVDTDCCSLRDGSTGARMAEWLGTYGPAAFGGGNLPRPGTVAEGWLDDTVTFCKNKCNYIFRKDMLT